MAIAHLNSHRRPNRAANRAAQAPRPTQASPTTTPKAVTSVPSETEARGFALYVGIDEAEAKAAGTTLAEVVNALRAKVAELVPAAHDETFAAVALAPKGIGGKNVDIVRTALRDPRALDKLVSKHEEDESENNKGILVDFSRKKVFANGNNAELTYKEFELLSYLITHEGATVSRNELIELVWDGDENNAPSDRTIDVHIRRLRSKIAGYEDIIRTVRGGGYRFDKHPDVHVEDYSI
jgi:DNA-binding response OmpR family regulator